MRENPQFENASEVSAEPQRTRDFLEDLAGSIEDDDADRFTWLENKAHFQKRRYGKYDRTPEFPWPGSSNVVMPLIDKTIDTLKPSYINLAFASKPPVTVYGANMESRKNEANVELWWEYMIKFGGSPRYKDEITYAVDECLELGRGILKTHWEWKTAPVPETLIHERLPRRLRSLVVTSKSQEEADNLAAAMQEMGMPPVVLTVEEFDERRDFIKQIVVNEFHLDEGHATDREACRRIMAWLRAGAKQPLTVTKRDVYVNAPAVSCVSGLDLIVPSYTNDIQDAERITHRMFFSETMVMQRAASSMWDKNAVKMLVDERRKKTRKNGRGSKFTRASRQTYMDDQRDIAGVDRAEIGEEYEIYEVCAWYADATGKSDRKVVVTLSPDMPEHPLKFVVYQRPTYKWPYHSFPFEQNKKGWFTPRGIPELLDDLEAEITWQHRQKLNRMAIANSPTFMYRVNSKINPNTWRWMPGRFFPVQNVQTDVAPIVVPNVQMSEEREEQILRTWAQDRIGAPDTGIASDLSSLTEPRTATEIRQIQGLSRGALSMRGDLFQRCMNEVYHEMFSLFIEFGDHRTWIQVAGSEPILLTKEELQGEFVFQSTGTIGEADPAMDAMKAQARLMLLFQIAQTGALGDASELDLGAAVLDWLEKDDIRLARKIVRQRSPQEIQQIQAERQRKQKLVEAANANIPMNLPDLREAVTEIKGQSPHKGAQEIDMVGTMRKAMSGRG